MIPCPEGRFLNDTNFTDSINLVGEYLCLKNTTIGLQGAVSSK